MEIICLHDEAFYASVDKVTSHIKEKKRHYKKMLDTGVIRFSQPEKKLILYDLNSIDSHFNKHANEL